MHVDDVAGHSPVLTRRRRTMTSGITPTCETPHRTTMTRPPKLPRPPPAAKPRRRRRRRRPRVASCVGARTSATPCCAMAATAPSTSVGMCELKPELKAPGFHTLKLKYYKQRSKFASITTCAATHRLPEAQAAQAPQQRLVMHAVPQARGCRDDSCGQWKGKGKRVDGPRRPRGRR
jgi:hypothetical protein